ncbi:DUF1217 domain-containing protein [Methylobacterium brachiatum]|uniref:DUF1217 domain-containing protein n=1 Tax=Methylobacterium brachiatum TaxID=269660 RepID=UPI00244B938D|nr:DUF1217 domain-containing protein [Methylobacterium brachiatum]MDH2312900.1 DUF1217 domain-containing protein [Methylobacterium brachiatum]
MLSTFIDYKTIVNDLPKTLNRTASQGASKREIQYFQDHIGQVKTVDDFIGNNRLFTFAMKAFGLDDMTYAKAFMKKVLQGEPDMNGRVLADRLQDSRYRDFAAAFSFRAFGEDPNSTTTSPDPELQKLIDEYAGAKTTPQERKAAYDAQTVRDIKYFQDSAPYVRSIDDVIEDSKFEDIVRTAVGLPPRSDDDDDYTRARQIEAKVDAAAFKDPEQFRHLVDSFTAGRFENRKAIVDPYYRPPGTYADSDAEIGKLTQYFQAKMSAVYSSKDIAADPVLTGFVLSTLGISAGAAAKSTDALASLIDSKIKVTSLRDPKTLSQFIDRFKMKRGEARETVVDAYVRQTLETDSGNENEGVRLALYFQRKAGSINSPYGFLADPALAQVVRTTLGLPPETAKSSIESQARLIERKIDISSLKDPEKLDQFIKRFTLMWDAQNNPATSPALSFLGAADSSLDTDLLVRLQSIRLGGR